MVASHSFFKASNIVPGPGEMAKLIRAHDWSNTKLGPPEFWPQSLKTTLSICLGSKFPMFIWWGNDLIVFYNDAYIPLAGPLKHPIFLGRPASEQWAEIWNVVGPLAEKVLATGIATWSEDLPLFMTRSGFLEETYFTFSYSPALNESGSVGGVFCAVQETTGRMIGERRLKTLRDLGSEEVRSVQDVIASATKVLKRNLNDIPFSLVYMSSDDEKSVNLAGESGVLANTKLAPLNINLISSNQETWPLSQVKKTRRPQRVDGLRTIFSLDLPKTPYEEMPDSAYVFPLELTGKKNSMGFLILGISPRLEFNDRYHEFFFLICKYITNQMSSVLALEEEKKRSEGLAEIDRTKTQFFTNVSHEFRTPLTLMLGPLEDSLSDKIYPLQFEQRKRQELIHRNAIRLFKLVNSLLDFSRIEAGRMQVNYEATDLAKLTRELASHFETVMSKANIKYTVLISPLKELVYVDREMWEKIVLNLISNAFKFTLKGEIQISLKDVDDHVELAVKDSGIGIPTEELPNIFKRFYRVEGSRGRTYEGTGIGLSLIQELVKIHGGSVSVTSKVNEGSTFIVKIPLGNSHLSKNHLSKKEKALATTIRPEAFTEEAIQWLPNVEESQKIPSSGFSSRILLADDNADMRAYVESLLSPYWRVTSVHDGQEAYEEALRGRYDLVLSDVMMPRLDGFGLVRKLRDNPVTKTISIILISARAGEEAQVSEAQTGADDYLVKPFSGKELVARIKTHLELKRLRDERLKLSEERLKLALSSAQMGTWEWDLKTNRIILDDMTQKLFGLTAKIASETYEDFKNLIHSEDRERTLNLISKSIEDHTVFNSDYRIIRSDGSIHWIQGVGQPLYDVEGKPYQLLGIIFDITERKQNEENLKTAIRLRDEFLIIASHELKTPLTSLKLQLQIIRRGIKSEKEIIFTTEQLLKSIDKSLIQTNQLSKLIEDMLDATRMQIGMLVLDFEKVNLGDLIRQVYLDFTPSLASVNCKVQLEIDSDIVGYWDKARIEQVLVNLLSNALKYAPHSTIRITAVKKGTEAMLNIQDSGPGIPKEKQLLIFNRFERVNAYLNTTGLGLGLYICREIIRAHNGAIHFESEEGKGVSISISLPLNC